MPSRTTGKPATDDARDHPRRGRHAEATRNDTAIVEAAREVLLRDPEASMAAIAQAAGVGVGGLYRRYAGRDELLQRVCGDGLHRFVELAEQALADDRDGWSAFETFLGHVVDAD